MSAPSAPNEYTARLVLGELYSSEIRFLYEISLLYAALSKTPTNPEHGEEGQTIEKLLLAKGIPTAELKLAIYDYVTNMANALKARFTIGDLYNNNPAIQKIFVAIDNNLHGSVSDVSDDMFPRPTDIAKDISKDVSFPFPEETFLSIFANTFFLPIPPFITKDSLKDKFMHLLKMNTMFFKSLSATGNHSRIPTTKILTLSDLASTPIQRGPRIAMLLNEFMRAKGKPSENANPTKLETTAKSAFDNYTKLAAAFNEYIAFRDIVDIFYKSFPKEAEEHKKEFLEFMLIQDRKFIDRKPSIDEIKVILAECMDRLAKADARIEVDPETDTCKLLDKLKNYVARLYPKMELDHVDKIVIDLRANDKYRRLFVPAIAESTPVRRFSIRIPSFIRSTTSSSSSPASSRSPSPILNSPPTGKGNKPG